MTFQKVTVILTTLSFCSISVWGRNREELIKEASETLTINKNVFKLFALGSVGVFFSLDYLQKQNKPHTSIAGRKKIQFLEL